ncbi:MAG: hypothetical protein ABS77_10300 [Phenylobacterium sp. SCN 69-14]|nr:MAG: hypothetical protein ABS77_10300 [Phenylobacterium sp. SCN 69-14]
MQQTATGFTGAGVTAVGALAKTYRPSLGPNSRRASNATLAKVIGEEMIRAWAGRTGAALTQSDFADMDRVVGDWFAALAQVREHIVPCTLFPYPVPSFSVGPITFRHFSEMPVEGFGVSHDEFWPKQPEGLRLWARDVWAALRRRPVRKAEVGGFRFSSLTQFATERAAPWLAFVRVPGRSAPESVGAADLAADIALAAIQLVSPGDDMRRVARASGRAGPIWRVDVSRAEDGTFTAGSKNLSPALARSQDLIEQHMKGVAPVLDSMGQRLAGFLDALSAVPILDEAWCNAAYWYHEALAETLDTVAVAKLETAIEVLFRAESMSGSKRRLTESFEVFFGLKPGDKIGSGTVTVEQFVESITTARSRVLHGTWPTLHLDLAANKSGQTISYADVEFLTRTLLVSMSVSLDDYVATSSPVDTTEALFAWILAQRAQAAAPAAAAHTGP